MVADVTETIRIVGTGSYLPQKVLTNHDFEKMLDTFRKAEVEENMDCRELSDDEIDMVAAAGAEARLQERYRCKKCQKVFKTYYELEKHQRDNICGVRG